MFSHLNRHLNEIVFMRCYDSQCCGPWNSESLKEFLLRNRFGQDGRPTAEMHNLGKCWHCPNYFFKSKTAKQRHLSMFHRRQKIHKVSRKNKTTKSAQKNTTQSITFSIPLIRPSTSGKKKSKRNT